MKTVIPKLLINPQTTTFEKSNVTMRMKVLLLFMFVVFFTDNMIAQSLNSGDAPVIKEINSYLNSNSQKGAMRRTSEQSYSDVQDLRDLVTKTMSAVYLQSGRINTYGESPVKLFTDVSSLNLIQNSTFLKDNIEIVTISVKNSNELNTTVDMSLLSDLTRLKYIYFVFDVNANENDVARMIRNANGSEYTFYYKVENKS